MLKESYTVIGVMSGTSLDGVDLAHINFTVLKDKWQYKILESETVSYNDDWLNKLRTAVDFSKAELKQLNQDYTILLGISLRILSTNTKSPISMRFAVMDTPFCTNHKTATLYRLEI